MTNLSLAKKFLKQLKEPYAWPGGYPCCFITRDGEALSFKAAEENKLQIVSALLGGEFWSDWYVVGVDINWEDGDMYCCHSGDRIESAYDEPEPELERCAFCGLTLDGPCETPQHLCEKALAAQYSQT